MNPFTESTVAVPVVVPAPAAASGHEPCCADVPLSGCPTDSAGASLSCSVTDSVVISASAPTPAPVTPPRTPFRAMLVRSGLCLVLLGSAYANTVHAIDVNAASADQLEGVRGIGPKTARVIVAERARGGRFESFDDLSDRVKGIGPAKVATLKSAGLTVQGALGVVPGAAAPGSTSAAGRANPSHNGGPTRGALPGK
ncbi:MAG: ComEA family DNA-binding protein [Pusillimonas sp.]